MKKLILLTRFSPREQHHFLSLQKVYERHFVKAFIFIYIMPAVHAFSGGNSIAIKTELIQATNTQITTTTTPIHMECEKNGRNDGSPISFICRTEIRRKPQRLMIHSMRQRVRSMILGFEDASIHVRNSMAFGFEFQTSLISYTRAFDNLWYCFSFAVLLLCLQRSIHILRWRKHG